MEPSSTLPVFSAMLLAGGQSQRMGRDKAAVEFRGEALWKRQLSTLEMLHPQEIFISGKPGGSYDLAGREIVSDVKPACGPISGVAAGLQRCRSPWLLVLAIDLPEMTSAFLSGLVLRAGESAKGLVPFDGTRFHPLAAIYPRECLPLADEGLRSGDASMQRFVQRSVAAGLLAPIEIFAAELRLFENVNTPEDLRRLQEGSDSAT